LRHVIVFRRVLIANWHCQKNKSHRKKQAMKSMNKNIVLAQSESKYINDVGVYQQCSFSRITVNELPLIFFNWIKYFL